MWTFQKVQWIEGVIAESTFGFFVASFFFTNQLIFQMIKYNRFAMAHTIDFNHFIAIFLCSLMNILLFMPKINK